MDIEKAKIVTENLALSNRARKRVVAALSGWYGTRILAAHGGDVSAASSAIESVRAVRGNAHRANLAAQASRQRAETRE